MDKKSFLNSFNYEDKTVISNIYDKISLAEKCGRTIFYNEFLPSVLWASVLKLKNQFNVEIDAYGVFSEAERRMLVFTSFSKDQYPIHILNITNKSHFNILQHKDYLGAMMSLGIKREKLGDLMVNDKECFVPVCNEISHYIKMNLQTIGKCPCNVEIIDNINIELPSANLEDIIIISTSTRVDCVIGALCNISRTSAVELINQGKVLINYEPVDQKDYTIIDNSIITVRGYGKFKYCSVIGTTSKSRLKINIQKYK